MWNTAGVSMRGVGGWVEGAHRQPAGSSAGVNWSPRQELTGPIKVEAQASSMHVNQAVRGVGSRASVGARCHGHSRNRTILPEKVNDVERRHHFGYMAINLPVGVVFFLLFGKYHHHESRFSSCPLKLWGKINHSSAKTGEGDLNTLHLLISPQCRYIPAYSFGKSPFILWQKRKWREEGHHTSFSFI